MAKVFQTWTVLPHKPIEKLSENLWRVEGTMPDPSIRRVMTIARLRDGRLLIHNAIALGEAEMQDIERFGTPAVIVVPNGFHRQDAKIYKDRYPNAAVHTPSAARKKVEQVVPVTGDYEQAPQDDTVRLVHLEGCKGNEGIMEVHSADGTSVVFNDAIFNIPRRGGVVGYLVGPTGRPAIPRIARWMIIKDKPACAAHMQRLATPELRRIIVSHGEPITDTPAETLRQVSSVLVN